LAVESRASTRTAIRCGRRKIRSSGGEAPQNDSSIRKTRHNQIPGEHAGQDRPGTITVERSFGGFFVGVTASRGGSETRVKSFGRVKNPETGEESRRRSDTARWSDKTRITTHSKLTESAGRGKKKFKHQGCGCDKGELDLLKKEKSFRRGRGS